MASSRRMKNERARYRAFGESESPMAFSEGTIKQAWLRDKAKCERCGKQLVWSNQGRETDARAWEARHKVSGEQDESDTLSNFEILCWECYKKTL